LISIGSLTQNLSNTASYKIWIIFAPEPFRKNKDCTAIRKGSWNAFFAARKNENRS